MSKTTFNTKQRHVLSLLIIATIAGGYCTRYYVPIVFLWQAGIRLLKDVGSHDSYFPYDTNPNFKSIFHDGWIVWLIIYALWFFID